MEKIERTLFKALSHPKRREILDLVSKEPMYMNDLAKAINLTRQSVERHVNVLIKSKLVEKVLDKEAGKLYVTILPGAKRLMERLEEEISAFIAREIGEAEVGEIEMKEIKTLERRKISYLTILLIIGFVLLISSFAYPFVPLERLTILATSIFLIIFSTFRLLKKA